MMPCVLVDGNGRFGETCCLYLPFGNRSTKLGLCGIKIWQHRNKICKILRRVAIDFDCVRLCKSSASPEALRT